MNHIHNIASQRMDLKSQRMKFYYDQKDKRLCFDAGQKVWFFTPRRVQGRAPKLQSNWEGLYVLASVSKDLLFRSPNIWLNNNSKKSASPSVFLNHGFSEGLRANAEAGTWGVFKDVGSTIDTFPSPPCPKKSRKKRTKLKIEDSRKKHLRTRFKKRKEEIKKEQQLRVGQEAVWYPGIFIKEEKEATFCRAVPEENCRDDNFVEQDGSVVAERWSDRFWSPSNVEKIVPCQRAIVYGLLIY
ncbi:hypothetical protein P5V15_002733 [Pogonomyrmex californicus]